jgi:hypothetical protein
LLEYSECVTRCSSWATSAWKERVCFFTNAPTPAIADAVTDDAVNLAYSLGLSATTGTGTGVDQAYTVTGTMALGQSGNCAALGGACVNTAATNKNRTIYVVY